MNTDDLADISATPTPGGQPRTKAESGAPYVDSFTAEAPLPLPPAADGRSSGTEPPPSLSTPVPTAAQPKSSGLGSFIAHALVCAALVGVALYVGPYLLVHWRTAEGEAEAEVAYQKRRAELKAEAEAADLRLEQLDKKVQLVSLGFREVARKIAPLVVNVANLREPRDGVEGVWSKKAFVHDPETDRKLVQSGVGSGIILDNGHILTNHHVVKGAQRLRLTFASGQALIVNPDAVLADPITDLAVIKLTNVPAKVQPDLQVKAVFADSDKDVHVGDWALAAGSPLGLKQTVTQGVISAKGRLLSMLDLVELLQTDAAINPGNSGGPLFDQLGRVAGINVAIASDNGASQGIGFAIPSNTAKAICAQLIAKGEVVRGYLGIALDEPSVPEAAKLGLKDAGGVIIMEVHAEHAAAKAGLQVGDVIVGFNKQALAAVHPMRQLRQFILETEPGSDVTLEFIRDGRRQTVNINVGKRPTKLP